MHYFDWTALSMWLNCIWLRKGNGLTQRKPWRSSWQHIGKRKSQKRWNPPGSHQRYLKLFYCHKAMLAHAPCCSEEQEWSSRFLQGMWIPFLFSNLCKIFLWKNPNSPVSTTTVTCHLSWSWKIQQGKNVHLASFCSVYWNTAGIQGLYCIYVGRGTSYCA